MDNDCMTQNSEVLENTTYNINMNDMKGDCLKLQGFHNIFYKV